jgi:hypothetical protein
MEECRFFKQCPQAGDDEICQQCDHEITCPQYQILEKEEEKNREKFYKPKLDNQLGSLEGERELIKILRRYK